MKKLDVSNFVAVCREFLNLDNPCRVRVFRRNIPGFAEVCGLYKTKRVQADTTLYEHEINVSIERALDSRDILAVLAHEFVHAWQVENGYALHRPHGYKFRRKAAELQLMLAIVGYDIPAIYIKGIDV